MKSIVRASAVAIAFGLVGFYLWYGITYEPASPYTGELAWAGPQLIAPILAIPVIVIAFVFTSDGIVSALTGRNSAAFRAGQVGIATVRAIEQTGVQINDQPQVRLAVTVETAEGKTFSSHLKTVVPLTELAQLRPGLVLPVRYLPGREDKVELDLSGDRNAAQNAYNQAMIRQGITTPAKLDIAKRGVAARAVVQSLQAPGEIRHGHSRIDLSLAVTRPDGSIFTTAVSKFMTAGSLPYVQVGRVVDVHYLPGDESDVVLAIPAA